MRTAVVIQARMGSERFPGKILADLAGKPMLGFMLARLLPLRADGIDLWVATTDESVDDQPASMYGGAVRFFRGSSSDVLSRYREIAKNYDVIVRLTGDCPLLWAGLVRHVLDQHERHGGDYTACLQVDGLEVQVYESEALEEIQESDWSREHVGPPPGECHWVRLPSLSVDTPEDLRRVREFVGR